MRIGIIAAMKEELALLVDHLECRREVRFNQFTYFEGHIHGVQVTLFLCGIGKVNAAVGATLLIDKLKPDYLINTGVAGAFPDDIALGDVIISSEVRHHDADATAFNYEFGQIPQMPAAFIADEYLVALAASTELKDQDIDIYQGPILSGDSFIHQTQQILEIIDRFPNIMAVEMEGAAIAQTSYLFDIPFVLIRSVSDKVKHDKSKDIYERNMSESAKNSVRIILNMIEKMKENPTHEKNNKLYH